MLAMFFDRPNHVNIKLIHIRTLLGARASAHWLKGKAQRVLHGCPLCFGKGQLKKSKGTWVWNHNRHHHQNKWKPRIVLKHYILRLHLTETDLVRVSKWTCTLENLLLPFSMDMLGKASTSSGATISAPERWAGGSTVVSDLLRPLHLPPRNLNEVLMQYIRNVLNNAFVSAVFVETCSLYWGDWASQS